MYKAKSKLSGFTIVELLVVIVVIGILAAITIVSYTGISQKAVAASLQSDLSGASKQLKMYQVEYSAYPAGIVENPANSRRYCPNPDQSGGRYCFRASPGNTFDILSYLATTQTFSLTAGSGSTSYVVTHSSSPTVVVVATYSATGGTITYTDSSGANPRSSPAYAGGYTVHTFTTSGTLTVTGTINNANVLVVGGGGGGGYHEGTSWYGGGGGCGQVMSTSANLSGNMSIVVSPTAAGGNSGHWNGYTGGVSSFAGNTAIGGGYGAYGGASSDASGGNGACGGGGYGNGSASHTGLGGLGSVGYNGGSYSGFGSTGGGGGMGSAGDWGDNSSDGDGGSGISSTISGIVKFYGAGGGSTGGSGVGGNWGGDAVANTGSGGGSAGGAGSSGVVIIRYPTP